jgi:hypothetical protein
MASCGIIKGFTLASKAESSSKKPGDKQKPWMLEESSAKDAQNLAFRSLTNSRRREGTGAVMHVCNPSHVGGEVGRNYSLRQAWAKVSETLPQKTS